MAAVTTLAVMMVSAGPWGSRETGDTVIVLIMLPFLAAWAVGPYFVCNRFMQEADPRVRWVFMIAGLIAAVPVLWIYIDGLILTQAPDAQIGVVFVIFPLYQFAFVLAVFYGVRFWRVLSDK